MAIHPGFRESSYDAVLHYILTRKREMSQNLFLPAEFSASAFGDIAGTDDAGEGFAEDAAEFVHHADLLARIDARDHAFFEAGSQMRARVRGGA